MNIQDGGNKPRHSFYTKNVIKNLFLEVLKYIESAFVNGTG